MIEIRLLRNAVILDEHRNFARAANALNITQPTLSRSIQLLERLLNEQLFDRSHRIILPTQAGEIVLKHARSILSSSRAMASEIDRHQGVLSGHLNIGTAPFPAAALMGTALNLFYKRYPDIHLDINVDNGRKFPEQLLQKDFDLAVIESSQMDSSDFDLTPLDRHPGFLFCRHDHPLWENQIISSDALAQYPLISIIPPKRLAKLLGSLFPYGQNLNPGVRRFDSISCNNLALINTMVSNSNAIGLGTYGTLSSEINSGQFKPLPLRFSELKTGYDILTRKGATLSPATRAFIHILIESDKQQSILEAKLIRSLGPILSV